MFKSTGAIGATGKRWIALAACGVVSVACNGTDQGGGTADVGDVGQVAVALTNTPTGVQCIRLTATPSAGNGTVQTYSVSSGSSTTNLMFGPLTAGTTTITGEAFTVACSGLGSAAPSWTSDPVTATIRNGSTTNLVLTFRKATVVSASANFVGNIARVVAGGYSTIAVTDGAPLQWGSLGGLAPAPVPGLPDAIAAAVGTLHACAIRNGGTVWCWGLNSRGQVGPGIPLNATTTTPVQVPGLSGVTQIAAAALTTCAYRPTPSTVYCWGYGADGELGNNTLADSSTPVVVSGLGGGVKQLVAGSYHFLAVTPDGRVSGWGLNINGPIGDGTTSNRMVPTQNSEVAVQSVGAGAFHSCSLRVDGTVRCWGWNGAGQLGDGTTAQKVSPTQIGVGGQARQLTLGNNHSCAALADGRVMCWGYDFDGELGDASTVMRLTAGPVMGLPVDAGMSIAAGLQHTCALTSISDVYCWGNNGSGQIGDGTNNYAFVAVKVTLQ
jgi:hypothetical protein